jgi:hypothetical protein
MSENKMRPKRAVTGRADLLPQVGPERITEKRIAMTGVCCASGLQTNLCRKRSRIHSRTESQPRKRRSSGSPSVHDCSEISLRVGSRLSRLAAISPIVLYTIMLLNRECAIVKGSRIVSGYPVLNSTDGKTYVYLMQLGLKFYTRFKDGSILLTKSFGGTAKFGPNVIFQRL